MNVMIDDSVDTKNTLFNKHNLTRFSIDDMPDMPYDTDKELVAQWLYSKAVDHDAEMAIVVDAEVARWMNRYGIDTLSITQTK